MVRFKTPLSGRTEFDDIVRGHVAFENETLDDFVLLKSDGFPTYHLANVVDDHVMEITHVLRAEEWLPSTPRHLLLYAALGYAPPQFAHLPMILGADRAKLSKRHGAVSLLEYKRQGYLPEAMFNFLGLLGWSLDDHTEIISREDFVRHFSLERIVKNPAIFDVEKLTWMNGVYMRQLPAGAAGGAAGAAPGGGPAAGGAAPARPRLRGPHRAAGAGAHQAPRRSGGADGVLLRRRAAGLRGGDAARQAFRGQAGRGVAGAGDGDSATRSRRRLGGTTRWRACCALWPKSWD